MISYATYSDYTVIHSDYGITPSELANGWLPYGTQRVNENLGGWYTLPFSSNNATARSLCVDYAHLGILIRTRRVDDAEELRNELKDRIAALTSSGAPMMTDSSGTIYPGSTPGANLTKAWSNTMDYKPVFDLRNPIVQRVDPDQTDDDWDADDN